MWKQNPASIVILSFPFNYYKPLIVIATIFSLGRCRGCRNPHTPAGKKLRPFLNEPGDCSNASTSSIVTDLNLPSYVLHGTSLYSNRYNNLVAFYLHFEITLNFFLYI